MSQSAPIDSLTKQLLTLVQEPILLHSSDGTILWANKKIARLLGEVPEKLVDQPIRQWFPHFPVTTASTFTVTTEVNSPSGATSLLLRSQQLGGESVNWHALLVLGIPPVSAEAVKELITDEINDPETTPLSWYWEMDENLQFKNFSDNTYAITGYSREELLGIQRRKLISEEWLANHTDAWQQHIATLHAHRPFSKFNYVLVCRNGSALEVEISGAPIFDEHGQFSGYIGSGQSLSNDNYRQPGFAFDISRTQQLLENSPIGVGITNRIDSTIQYANRRLSELFGAPPSFLIGKHSEIMWKDIKVRQDLLHSFDRKGQVATREVELRRLDGSSFWCLLTWESISLPDSNGILFWVYDIDQLKQVQSRLQQSETRFKNIAESASDWFWEMDSDLRFTFVSDRFYEVTGTTPESILGKTRTEVAGDAQIAKARKKWAAHLSDLEHHRPFRDFTYRIDGAQGAVRYIKLSGSPVFSEHKDFLGFCGAGTDVTAEEKLRLNEQRLRTVLNTTAEGFMELDAKLYPRDPNPAMCNMLGYSNNELLSLPLDKWIANNTRKEVISHLKQLKTTTHISFETELIHHDGHAIPVLVNATALDKQGAHQGAFAFFSDLSKQKQVEHELLEHRDRLEILVHKRTADLERSNQRLQKEVEDRRQLTAELALSEIRLSQIVNFMPEALLVIDNQGTIIAWNKAIEEMTGCSTEEMLGKANYEYALPFYGERRPVMIDLLKNWDDSIAEQYQDVRKDGDTLSSETHLFKKDGSRVYYWNSARPLYDFDNNIVGAIEVIRDITDMKQAEAELLQAQQYVENIFNSLPSILIGTDREGRITQWNTKASEITSTSATDALGKPLQQLLPEFCSHCESIQDAIRQGQSYVKRIAIHNSRGDKSYWDVSSFPLSVGENEGAVIRIDDVTEKIKIEEVMVQSEKMLSVGGLAAGMAHEINNPLAGILQSTQVIRNRLSSSLKKNAEVAEQCGTSMELIQSYMRARNIDQMVDSVIDSSRRAAKIVENMLSFSRKEHNNPERMDIIQLVEDTLELAANDYDLGKKYDFRHIAITKEFAPNLPMVMCQPSKIQQVILNLLRNGAHAMSTIPNQKPHFTLRLSSDDQWVQFEVEDNGPGMKQAVRRRAFEPFFTTKDVGIGTGLGLSVSYFIITENHQGLMSVESTPGQGCNFIIKLPTH